jgi:hypothetical protein
MGSSNEGAKRQVGDGVRDDDGEYEDGGNDDVGGDGEDGDDEGDNRVGRDGGNYD